MAERIEGVRETIALLRQLDKQLARESVNKIKAPALSTAAQLRALAPATPLSGMGYFGPTKVRVGYGGRRSRSAANREFPLVKIRLLGPSWTASSDMARKSTPGESMVPNLTRKYGRASRWAWPTVEQRAASIVVAIRAAVAEVEKDLNAALKKGS